MSKLILLCSASFLTGALAVCAYAGPADQPGHRSPAPGSRSDTISAISDSARHAVGLISVEMTTTLRGFSQEVATNDMFEMEAARVALKRSHNGQVRAFAERMMSDHKQSEDRLRDVLLKIDHAPSLPKHLDDRRQGMIDELRGARDSDFDGRYLSQQVNAHNEALILMRGYGNTGDTTLAKQFARQSIETVELHLRQAEQLLNDHDRRS